MKRRSAARPDCAADGEEPIIDTRENESHLGAEEIARLLDGSLDEIQRAKILDHLQVCRRCVESYLDSAAEMGFQRVRETNSVSTWKVASPGGTAPPRGQSDDPHAPIRPGDGVSRRIPRSGSKVRTAVVAISVVVVTAVLWYVAGMVDRSPSSGLRAEDLRPIELAAGEFSRVGEIVLPGSELYLGENDPVFRSNGRASQALASSLKQLVERFNGGSRSPEVAYWLVAGYLSSGDLRTANVYAAAARERFPNEPRLKILDAAVAYFRADFARAESLLREVIKAGVADPLAGTAEIDLALVLREQGRITEARELLLSVSSRPDAGSLARRGRDLAASLKG